MYMLRTYSTFYREWPVESTSVLKNMRFRLEKQICLSNAFYVSTLKNDNYIDALETIRLLSKTFLDIVDRKSVV